MRASVASAASAAVVAGGVVEGGVVEVGGALEMGGGELALAPGAGGVAFAWAAGGTDREQAESIRTKVATDGRILQCTTTAGFRTRLIFV